MRPAGRGVAQIDVAERIRMLRDPDAQRERAGAVQGLHLVVPDIKAALADLDSRNVPVSAPFHFGAAAQTPGLHPERSSYGSFRAGAAGSPRRPRLRRDANFAE